MRAFCQHKPPPLSVSITLHICAVLILWFTAGREIITHPVGTAAITVHLVSMAQEENKTPEKKIVVKEKSAVPVKQAEPVQQKSAPQHQWQEAKAESTGPKIIYQPMPKIPDELRREVLDTSAMARFHIDADGNATVELLTPSQNPRLNHILLETLKTWKFAPGSAGATTFDIRVHFAVE